MGVAQDIWQGMSKKDVCEKYRLAAKDWESLCGRAQFTQALSDLESVSVTHARAILGRALPEVAERLLELARGEKEETARKACMDVLESAGVFEDTRQEPAEVGWEDLLIAQQRSHEHGEQKDDQRA